MGISDGNDGLGQKTGDCGIFHMGAVDLSQVAKQSSYRVDRIARRLGFSERQLERAFSIEYGTTPHSWLAGLKMQEAEQRLALGERIKSVADSLGYLYPSSFCRQFKKYKGKGPRQFLKAIQIARAAACQQLTFKI